MGFAASETDWGYELWTQWRALGKPPQVSVLMNEIANGYGGIIAMLLQFDSLYAKIKQQLDDQESKK